MNDIDYNTLLSSKETAKLLKVSTVTLHVWRTTGKNSLPFIKLGPKTIKYRLSDIKNFLEERTYSYDN